MEYAELEKYYYQKCLELAILKREEFLKNGNIVEFIEANESVEKYKKLLGV